MNSDELPQCFMCWTDHDPDETACPPPRKPKFERELGEPFPARFNGMCEGCNLPIHIGQEIRAVDYMEYTRYIHISCE